MSESALGRLYKDGEIVCSEGEEASSMYVIQSGKARVIKKTAEGEVTLSMLGSGDFFGEMSLFDHKPRSATVVAAGDARILKVDKKGFFARASEDPSFAFNILKGMTQRIRTLNDELSKFKGSR